MAIIALSFELQVFEVVRVTLRVHVLYCIVILFGTFPQDCKNIFKLVPVKDQTPVKGAGGGAKNQTSGKKKRTRRKRTKSPGKERDGWPRIDEKLRWHSQMTPPNSVHGVWSDLYLI